MKSSQPELYSCPLNYFQYIFIHCMLKVNPLRLRNDHFVSKFVAQPRACRNQLPIRNRISMHQYISYFRKFKYLFTNFI